MTNRFEFCEENNNDKSYMKDDVVASERLLEDVFQKQERQKNVVEVNIEPEKLSAATNKEKEHIKTAVSQLGDEDFFVRHNARKTLVNYREKALPYLKEAFNSSERDVRRGAEYVLNKMLSEISGKNFTEISMGLENKSILGASAPHIELKDIDGVDRLLSSDNKTAGRRLAEIPVLISTLEGLPAAKQEWAKRQIAELKEIADDYRNIPKVRNELLEKISNKKELRISDNENFDARDLKHFPIDQITMFQSQASDRSLQSVDQLKGVRTIAIVGCKNISDSGVEYLSSLEKLSSLTIRDTPISDKSAKYFESFPGLQRIDLSKTGVGNDTMAALGKLKDLQSIDVSNTDITDDGLQHLSALSKIRNLRLGHCRITDSADLSKWGGLELLDLSYTQISNKQIQNFAHMDKLRVLSLRGTQITDVSDLAKSRKLAILDLRASGVTDSGVPCKSSLEDLNLCECPLTDKAVPALITNTHLKTLNIVDTGISPKGIQRIKQALPNCRIITRHSFGEGAVHGVNQLQNQNRPPRPR
jgi:hypothetical protein